MEQSIQGEDSYSHSQCSREQETLYEINDSYHRKYTGKSISDLDLVCATGVKPQTRLAIDTRGLWAVLPVQGQDADSLQPADLMGSSGIMGDIIFLHCIQCICVKN